ncbi:hypothetical protein Mapa_014636 [Marchantia paleacea]|nr:hypothetical protein Mapa_014636 [Marchantia paleacea]
MAKAGFCRVGLVVALVLLGVSLQSTIVTAQCSKECDRQQYSFVQNALRVCLDRTSIDDSAGPCPTASCCYQLATLYTVHASCICTVIRGNPQFDLPTYKKLFSVCSLGKRRLTCPKV